MSIKNLGTTIVERTEDGILVLLPDGDVKSATSAKDARAMHNRWQKARTKSVALAKIEWRGFAAAEIPNE